MSTTVQDVPAGVFSLDPAHSSIGFAIRHNGVSTFRGEFEQVEGRLEDGVLVGTTPVDSIKTAIPDLKGHLLSPAFFDAEAHPTITFRSTEIQISQDNSVTVEGELTMGGATSSVTATGRYASGADMHDREIVGFDLETTIDRREFGVDWQAPLPNGGDVLSWDVTLSVNLALVKE